MAKITVISERKPVSLEIADLAYDYWLTRRFRNGSPEQDLLQAVLEVTFGRGRTVAAPRLSPVQKVVQISGRTQNRTRTDEDAVERSATPKRQAGKGRTR